MSAPTGSDYILWGALGCALVGTAHSEWSLAVSVGAHPWIAAAVPGALDLYVIRALQVRRDVFLSVLAMVAANVAWYLVHSGDLPVDWPLRSAVGAVAPLVVWRVHSLKYTRTREELLWGLEAGAGPGAENAPGFEEEPHPMEDECVPGPAPVWSPGYHLDGCDGVHPWEGPAECTLRAQQLAGVIAPDYVPAWLDVRSGGSADEVECAPASRPHLKAVPALAPEECAPQSALLTGDLEYLAKTQEYIATTDRPTVRGLKKYAGVGQARAERLLAHLGVRKERKP